MTTYAQNNVPLTIPKEGYLYTCTVTAELTGALPADTYTSSWIISRNGTSVLSLTPTVVAGTDEVTITLALTASHTAALESGEYHYELGLLESAAPIAFVMEGPLTVPQGVIPG